MPGYLNDVDGLGGSFDEDSSVGEKAWDGKHLGEEDVQFTPSNPNESWPQKLARSENRYKAEGLL